MRSITLLLDFFAPRLCSACSQKLTPTENSLCTECFNTLTRVDPVKIKFEFGRHFRKKNYISGFNSLFLFEKDKALQQVIHSIKYRSKFRTALHLGTLTGTELKEQILPWKIDIIIPVPLHTAKRIERGFNQSLYLAKGISSSLGISYAVNILCRNVYTATQTHMTKKEREVNVSGAFSVKAKDKIKNKNIMLVDDVITTGSTLNECAKVLLEAGALKVYALSLALAD